MGSELVSEGWGIPPWVWVAAGLSVMGATFAVGKWYGSVNSDRSVFKDFIKEVRNDIKEILKRLPMPVTSKSSPIQLTDFGRTVSECLRAGEIADQLAVQLKEKMQGLSAYDVQEECLRYVNNLYEPPKHIEDRIKDCAYQNGVKRSEVLRVLAVELRDRLLAEREKNA